MRRIRSIVIAVGILGLLVFGLGLHRVTIVALREPPRVVWKASYGTSSNRVGESIGLDGRHYGPLAFALLGKRLVVADSYNNRIIVRAHHSQVLEAAPLMVEDVAVTPSGAILVADNRQLGVWRLGSGRISRLIKIPQEKGVTEAIWHLGVGPEGQIVVQVLGFGQGQYQMMLNEYNRKGQFVRELARAQGGENAGLTPLAGHGPIGILQSFEISPSGELYVVPPSHQRYHRHIDVYRWDGQYVSQISIKSPIPILESCLLGVNRMGWAYVGINLTYPHRARVLVVSPAGTLINDIEVHAVPIYSAVYGRVSPEGNLYLVQSSIHHYVIDCWALTSRKAWRWSL